MAEEIEQVYNFERDLATARVLDKDFDKKAQRIDNELSTIRGTYLDPNYLRDPAPDEFTSAKRREEDKQKRSFEAYKQALDL